jgi:hypothetical protein
MPRAELNSKKNHIKQVYKCTEKVNTICKSKLTLIIKGDIVSMKSSKPEVKAEYINTDSKSQSLLQKRPFLSSRKASVKSEFLARNPLAYGKNARRPMYLNPVGPGDHYVPSFSAIETMPDSTKRSTPCFTIISKNSKIPYFPEFALDFKGKESPGIGIYNPDDSCTTTKFPKAYMTTAERFIPVSTTNAELSRQL